MKIEFNERLQDETPVEFTDDQVRQSNHKIMEIQSVAGFLEESLPRLTVGLRMTLLSNLEYYLRDLQELLGYEGDLAVEMEQRVAKIRAANEEIRRLEKLIGTQSADQVPFQLSVMHDTIYKFWSNLGFYLAEGKFSAGYGNAHYAAELHCHLTPLGGKKEAFDRVITMLDVRMEGGHDADILDTPKNREWIASVLKEQYPSAKIVGWEIHEHAGTEVIRSCNFHVWNLTELLPKDEKEETA